MENYNVLSKGAYVRPQTENFASVKSFLFIREEDKKYLLLKIKNPRAEAAEQINLKVTLLDKKGNTLKVMHLSSDRGGAANSSFAFPEKIEVDEDCCDFTAKVESAVYGGYLYVNGKDGVAVDYASERAEQFDVSSVKAAMRGKTRTVAERRLGIPVLVSVLACVLLACAALITYFQIKQFIDDATGFTYSGVEYEFENGDKSEGTNIIVTGYRGSKSKVVIPEKIDGHTVTEIRDSAFKGNSKIKHLKIEGNVKIGDYAFFGCSKLVSVNIDKAEEVGGFAFSECDLLTSLEITGGGEIALGTSAFKDCTRLQTVKIHKKIIYPEDVAVFSGDTRVKELYLENYETETCGSISLLFGANSGSYSLALKTLTIGYLDGICESFCANLTSLESVTVAGIEGDSYGIGDYAFYRTKLNTLDLPEGLNSVGNYAFSATEISSFNAEGAESIGEYAFERCKQLKIFSLPESLEVISEGAFYGCTSLESLTFAEVKRLEYLGRQAFCECYALTEVTLPDSVEYIGLGIFNRCENLESVTIPYIGNSVDEAGQLITFFNGCKNLKSVTMTSAKSLAMQTFYGFETLKEVNLNEGLEYIGSRAFYDCAGLKKITIPASVTDAGYDVFLRCFRLYEVYNLSSEEVYCNYAIAIYSSADQSIPKINKDGYTAGYSDGGFAQPEGWYLIDYPESTSHTLPDFDLSGYSVIDYLFYREKGITSVSLPEEVTGVGESAFYECSSLKEFSIPPSARVNEIKQYAFYGCESLTSFALPQAVTSVGASAFCGCNTLESVEFGENLTEIGGYAFSYCSALKQVYIPNTRAVTVCAGAFENCTSLTEVIFGGITGVGSYAFSGDSALESVQIAYADGTIGELAFSNCSALSEMYIPDGITSIGPYAFTQCKSLRKVTLPLSLKQIEYGAFGGCGRLRAVVNYSNIKISYNGENGGVGRLAAFIVTNSFDAEQLTFTEIDGVTFLHLRKEWAAVWCGDNITSLNLRAFNYGGEYVSGLKIADEAFVNSSLTAADLSAVTAIGNGAFDGCSLLEKVNLGANLTSVGDNAFARCTKLSDINLQDTKINYLGEAAFLNCSKLKEASLPRTLTAIPKLAFNYCTSLTDAKIPALVSSIGDDAFFGCSSLLQVHNLSPLSIRAGSSSNGFCGYYALCVFTDATSKMSFAESGDYKFANYNQSWYLYATGNYNYNYKLPESFIFENQTITSYKIRENAFNRTYIGNWNNYLIIPKAVTAIEDDAISSAFTIYYCGTSAQWRSIRPASLGVNTVYYYSECIHSSEGSLWTYDSYGYPARQQTQLEWTTTKEPTCVLDGVSTGKCAVCGYTQTQTIEKLGHQKGTDGKCARCGEQGEFVKDLNGTFASYSVSSSNFKAEDGTFVSTNVGTGTTAQFTVTAKKNMLITFSCYVTSGYDDISIRVGNSYYAYYSSGQECAVSLSAGQSLTFTYRRSGYSVSGDATINYILIFA